MHLRARRWDPSIRSALEALILRGPGLATLDWDNTCVAGDVSEAVLHTLGGRTGRSMMAEYAGLYTTDGVDAAYAFCAEVLGGLTPAGVEELAALALDEAVADGRVEYRPEIGDLVALMHDRGWEVWVVSASARPVIAVAAARLGIPRERVIGVDLIERDGAYEPTVVRPMPMFEGKVHAIRRAIGRRPTLAAGDSDNDVPMLSYAEHALLIARGHHQTERIARDRGWWVQTGWATASVEHLR